MSCHSDKENAYRIRPSKLNIVHISITVRIKEIAVDSNNQKNILIRPNEFESMTARKSNIKP